VTCKEKNLFRLHLFSSCENDKWLCFLLVTLTSRKQNSIFFVSPCKNHKENYFCKDNFYINVRELININISAASVEKLHGEKSSNHICLSVWRTTPRSLRLVDQFDWNCFKTFFSPCHIVKITRRKIYILNLSKRRSLWQYKTTVRWWLSVIYL